MHSRPLACSERFFESLSNVTHTLRFVRRPVAGLALLALAACGSFSGSGGKVNYKTDGEAKPVRLDVPPDLTQLARDSRYALPSGSVSANSLGTRQAAQIKDTVALREINDVRLERDGKQRWLVVNRSAEAVWPIVVEFWKENGFQYAVEQQQIGLLETEWAENRAKIPMDVIRRTLGKVLDGLYSSGERDKYRTRIERNATGGVDIYITHRGMMEEYKGADKSQTIWVPRANDPELEAEFLNRLMVRLGVSTDKAKAALAGAPASAAAPQPATVLQTGADGRPVIALREGFDVTWRRVGLSLDRTGFTVEDRDRSKGVYFVRYVDIPKQEEKGFFAGLFSASPKASGPVKYRIAVTAAGTQSEVRVQDESGQADTSDVAQRIYKLLADDLR